MQYHSYRSVEYLFPGRRRLEDVEISEMLPAKLGWNKAFVNDEIIRGYMGELQDFMEAVAYDRAPASGFSLAYETTKVIYAAYHPPKREEE